MSQQVSSGTQVGQVSEKMIRFLSHKTVIQTKIFKGTFNTDFYYYAIFYFYTRDISITAECAKLIKQHKTN